MTDPHLPTGGDLRFLDGGGDIARLMREKDWSGTSIGPPAGWPPALRTLVALMLGSGQPMYVAWGPGRAFLYNDHYVPFLGMKHPDALGRDLLAEVWPEIRHQLEPLLAATMAGEPIQVPRMLLELERNGYPEPMAFSFFFAPVRDDSGDVAGMFGACADVTQQERTEAELADAAERVQLALDAGAIIGTWVWTIEDNRFVADERFAHSFGIDARKCREGLPLEEVFESIHPEDRDRVGAAVQEALGRGGHYRCEYRVRRTDGQYIWIEANGRVELDAQGRPVRFPGVLLGHDERRRIEAERDQANTLLRNFLEAVPGVVFAKDTEGRLIVGNRGVAELLGVPRERYIGRTDRDLLADAAQAEAVMANDRRIMASGIPEQIEEVIQLPDGTPATWLSTKAPMRDGQGNVVGLVGASLDITERKRMEDALRQSEQRKDEFLAMLAHELRNPLAPIGTAAELLRLAPGDEARVNQVAQVILRQVAHMTEIVDDLLDVSRVTRGLVEFDREPVDLRTVISTAVEQVEPVLQARRHTLVSQSTGEAAIVIGDRHRLVQVVSNLLNNAAKYTPSGGRIEIALAGADNEVGIRVSDNGIGMNERLLPHVFDLFTQAERTPDRGQGGLGIGLALVRSIVQAHAGRVTAYSAGHGQGSTFAVALPRAPEDAEAAAAPVAPQRHAVPGRVVLVVDDNRDAADTLSAALELLGHDVSVAADGAQALEAAARRADWDAFILDIGMPDMTGHELVGRLRRVPGARGASFIALSGYGQLRDEEMSRDAGFDAHLVKPADIDRIQALLAQAGRG